MALKVNKPHIFANNNNDMPKLSITGFMQTI